MAVGETYSLQARENIMGKHSSGIQSPRDFRSTTAKRAHRFMLARRREERHVDYLLALTPRH